MTTIILVAFGVILAAFTAVMLMFFGGSALSQGTERAHAAILENAGTNVLSASELYKATNGGPPKAMTDLLSGGGQFMREAPSISVAATGTGEIVADGGDVLYRVQGVSPEVCEAVNRDLGNGAALQFRGTVRQGCLSDGQFGTFFVVL